MTDNGHLPAGASYLTLELLEQASIKNVRLPRASERLTREIFVRVRTIRAADYLACIPPIPGSETWPTDDDDGRQRQYRAWLASLTPEQLEAHQRMDADLAYKIVHLGAVEPKLTVEQVRSLGADADVVATEILRFSGLLKEPKAETPATEPVIEAPAASAG